MQLQCFLEFANFYHDFILGYNTLVAPLSALTSTKVPFTWSPAADRAFQDLKHCLTTAPILVYPDPSRQFVVKAYASDVGVEAVLSQRSALDLKVHPCVVFSHRLNATERNYGEGNRDLLAVKMALDGGGGTSVLRDFFTLT
jgi:hypothetical protein